MSVTNFFMNLLISSILKIQILNIENYFEHITKKYETIADNPPIQIYVNKIKKNRIAFKTKTSHKLELL